MRRTYWYNSRMLVVLLLLLVWPIGLYGLWRSYRFSRLAKTVWLLISVIPLLVLAHYSPYSIPGRWPITNRDSKPAAFDLGDSKNELLSLQLSAARMAQRQFLVGFDVDASKKITAADAGGQYRLCRYRAYYGFDESAPSSITVSGGGESDARTELSRTIPTYPVQDSSFSWRGLAVVFYVIFFILSCIVILVTIRDLSKSHSKEDVLIHLLFCALAIIPAALFGYVSGRNIVIDNATEKTVEVLIDGKKVALLPPLTFAQQRVVGSTLNVEVLENGHLLESGKLRLDAGINQAAEPAMLGRGKYIYNIGASNTYRVDTLNYSKQP